MLNDQIIKPARQARLAQATATVGVELGQEERARWSQHFGVAAEQIDHDFIISHLLVAIRAQAHQFIFYGGTALSRTILPDLRLSEDIDLLSIGARRNLASLLDQAIRDYMEPRFGQVTADPWLADAAKDTQACLFHIGHTDVKMTLTMRLSQLGQELLPKPNSPINIITTAAAELVLVVEVGVIDYTSQIVGVC